MTDHLRSEEPSAWSRRGFLLTAAALAAASQVVVQGRAEAAADLPGFPEGVEVYQSAYRNWVGEITAVGLWACAPRAADQVVQVVNWA